MTICGYVLTGQKRNRCQNREPNAEGEFKAWQLGLTGVGEGGG